MLHSLLRESIIVVCDRYGKDIWSMIRRVYYDLVINNLISNLTYKGTLTFIVIEVKSIESIRANNVYSTCAYCGRNISDDFKRNTYRALFKWRKVLMRPFWDQDDYHIFCYEMVFGFLPDFCIG
jgi:hypothetical protein